MPQVRYVKKEEVKKQILQKCRIILYINLCGIKYLFQSFWATWSLSTTFVVYVLVTQIVSCVTKNKKTHLSSLIMDI